MSGSATNFAGTLTGGIQDISALLPIIGTEQCEKHVGSALEGGFLYAVATPLSLFGSLGIVKAGISILVASISIPKPSLSFALLPKLSFTSSRRLWCGARVLDDAGFKLVGSVAPLIGMDAKRYKAESRLIEILEEKHIDTPGNLSVDWRSADWNISLIIGTIVAALISGTPYLYLLLRDPPASIHSPWVFPLLRTLGSCLATVCCQFLMQSRVISLMKSRIVFMIMHLHLIDDMKKGNRDESILKEQEGFRWDESFPAEECLWSLEQYLLSRHPSANSRCSCSFRQYMLLLKARCQGLVHILLSKVRIPAAQDKETHPHNSDVLEQWVKVLRQSEHPPDAGADELEPCPDPYPDPNGVQPFSNPDYILRTLLRQHAEHFRASQRHHTFIVLSWFLLLLSLPSAVVGYIGCFTLVTNSRSSGPLVWLGSEAALSVLRVLLWAWNPSFDEKTRIEVKLQLTKEQPPVTTQWDADDLKLLRANELPERQFLEHITPYTGPLDQFKKPDNTALYFAFTVNKERTLRYLFMTVLDLTNRAAFTLYNISKDEILYARTEVIPDSNSGEMLALIKWDSAVSVDHTRRINIPVHDLAKYYSSLLHSLTRSKGSIIASLPWRWSLVAKASENEIRCAEKRVHQYKIPTRNDWEREASIQANLSEHDFLRLQQSYEHHLKTQLMETWGKWIVHVVEAMYRDGCNECCLAPADPTSDEAKRELYAFNVLLVQEWTKRELAYLQLSAALENVLRSHVQQNAERLANAERKMTFLLEWSYDLQKQRLESERAQTRARGMTIVEKQLEQNGFVSIWQAGQTFVEEKWIAAIESRSFEEGPSEVTTEYEWSDECDDEVRALVEKLKSRFACWNGQRSLERREMEATIERISKADAQQGQSLAACSRFVRLPYGLEESTFVAKISFATVYDVYKISSADVIHTVTEKSSCRSLIEVDPGLIPYIPENDNLLFCSNKNGQEITLPFIQWNRNRWWEQQKTNSWTFYLSPWGVDKDGQYVYTYNGTIAHIMVFLQTPTHLCLHLLHCRKYDNVELLIQEKGREIQHLHPAEILKGNLRWQGYNLDRFEPGQHELQLVVNRTHLGWYCLRDVVLEFVNDTIVSNLTYSN